jgi:hypothetical protein
VTKSKNEIQQDYAKRSGYSANKKYNKEKTKIIPMRLMINTEQDIIRRLESVGNKSGYIKRLIREDITRNP